jgi:prepilin-type N-terminal cleavage/methylation domain-containing protein
MPGSPFYSWLILYFTDKTMRKRMARIGSCQGVTLLELLTVVSIVAIVSVAAIPMVNSVQAFALDNAVSQVKHALQFAREHARTTGDPVIVHFDVPAATLRVNRIDFSTGSAVETPALHPLIKKDYIVDLNANTLTGTSSGLRAAFTFSDGSIAPNVAFNANGVAGRVTGQNTFLRVKEPGAWRGFWRIGEGYNAGDWVEHDRVLYDCVSSHTAGSSFAGDQSYWKVRIHPGQVTVSAGPHQQDIFVEPNWGFVRVGQK